MLKRLLTILFAVVSIAGFAGTSHAQYMYLDTNGDGLNDATDVLNPNGTPTTVDVWLFTDQNAVGDPAICDGGAPLTINSFVVNLGVTGGTAVFTGFDNSVATGGAAGMSTVVQAEAGDSLVTTEWQRGQGSGTILPPSSTNPGGAPYWLMRVTVTGASLSSASRTAVRSLVCTPSRARALTSWVGGPPGWTR